MGVTELLIDQLPVNAIAVREVVVGVRWTAVTSRGCGLAATLLSLTDTMPHTLVNAGRLHQQSVQELAQGMISENPLEASIGLAAMCSALPPPISGVLEINAFDLLAHLGAGKKVVMVGHFPQAEWLKAQVGSLDILEKRPRPGDFPAEAAPDLLPKAELIAITGMTILNRTIDGLLRLCPPGARVVVLGPSTPVTPALFECGIDFISGSIVTDETSVLRTLMQGGSAVQARGTRKVTLCREPLTGAPPATNSSHGRI